LPEIASPFAIASAGQVGPDICLAMMSVGGNFKHKTLGAVAPQVSSLRLQKRQAMGDG